MVELSALPLAGVPAHDHALLTDVLRAMLCTHYPTKPGGQYRVEEEADHYNVSVPFPARTSFSVRQLDLVQLANDFLVIDVWVQPEHEHVLLCASVRKSAGAANMRFEQCEMRIIRRRLESHTTKRRRRTVVVAGTDDGGDDGGDGSGADGDDNAKRRRKVEADDKPYPRWHPMRIASEFVYRIL
ncbi:hypothetical protein LCGC14_3141460 [marine sediment metagenome]|uniref:Uncharacterized protein n=1 Tax=marine sediment metagenome TaxID=412755 RepID=A0A0F8VWT0_9ZZZZ